MKRQWKRGARNRLIIALFALILLLPAVAEADGGFSYYHKGELVSMHPSATLVVIDKSRATKGLAKEDLTSLGIVRHPLSDEKALSSRHLILYRITDVQKRSATGLTAKDALVNMATSINAPVQPVFEQGGALLVPTAQIIVGFDKPTDLETARRILSSQEATLGIRDVKPHLANSFLVTIGNAANGRAFSVCRALSQRPGVAFAEPNHLVIMMSERLPQVRMDGAAFDASGLMAAVAPSLKATANAAPRQPEGEDLAPGWQVILSLDGEGEAFPPAGWGTSRDKAATDAFWGRTDYRSREGTHSIYCAASGSAAVAPPGPVPTGMKAYLLSPVINFSPYQEVYIEVWFYAKNEIQKDQQGQPVAKDFAVLGVTNGQQMKLSPMLISFGDDCTVDPTTQKGWRKLLYRMPPQFRQGQARIFFAYVSDEQNQREGVYLDDIRVMARSKAESDPAVGNDPYGAMEYELENTGQIAGEGGRNHDMKVPEAWKIAPVSPNIVVAVIDDGVELRHPDLNVVAGYRPDGSPGGAPPDDQSNHGTSVAGNIGAIRNNHIGVIGMAPGVKIMAINQGGSFAEVAQAIDTAVAKGANILNNSWGWVGAPSQDIEAAVMRALKAGRIVIFAAGNGPDRPPFTYDVAFPGNMTAYTDVICVGATSQTDEHKSASSSDGLFFWGSSYVGPGPDVCAPGPWSFTTDRLGKAGYNDGQDGVDADYNDGFGGTSSATPKVSGIVALMLSVNPSLTPAQVKHILKQTADDIDAPGMDDKTGAGRVDALRAVQMAKSMLTRPASQSQRPLQTSPVPAPRGTPPSPSPAPANDEWQTVIQ
jgi:subtilisin family serine protease